MEAIFNSFALVFLSEMGDKTQLLALVLAARFRKPVPIMFGILVATILNHALASYVGSYITLLVSPEILKWVLATTFMGFGLWMLIPDKDEGLKEAHNWGPFMTTLVAFFLAEMGDKTQLATVALGAQFASPVLVTVGTTFGMILADGLAVFFGHQFTDKVSMPLVRRISCALFILSGTIIAFSS